MSGKRDDLKAKWENEKSVIQGIQHEKESIEKYKTEAEQAERAGDFGRVAEIRYGKISESEKKLEELKLKLQKNQGESSLLKEEVDVEDITEVVAKWTWIPVSKMLQNDVEKLLNLENVLSKKIV